MEALENRLFEIKKSIEKAAQKSKYANKMVEIVAVSKNQTLQDMISVHAMGIHIFAENRIQDFRMKKDYMPQGTKWHYIGNVQKNNIRHIIDDIDVIESIDSIEIATALNNQLSKRNKKMDILMQINIAKEANKLGFLPEESIKKARNLAKFEHLQVKGLMAVAPFVHNPEDNRRHFTSMRNLFIDISADLGKNVDMSVLSMGTSSDYMVAVEEGATILRLGTSLFGSREYI